MNARARSLVPTAALVAVAFLAGAATTRAQEGGEKKTKEQKARELLDVNGAAEVAKAQYMDFCDKLRKTPNVPKEFVDDFQRETKPGDLVEVAVGVYVRVVDEDAIDASIDFFKTDPGKKLAKVQTRLNRELQDAGVQWGTKATLKIFTRMAEAEQARKKAAEQPAQPAQPTTPPDGEKK